MTSSRASSTSSSERIPGFRIVRELGRGPRSVVYEAIQTRLDRRVALKLLPRDTELEARGVEWPHHPGVVRLHAVGTCEEGLFLAMQLIEGPALEELGARQRRAALADVAAALAAAHAEGVAHGRVHAGNVLVDANGRARLSDFGLGAGATTADDDREALAELMRAEPPPLGRGRLLIGAGVAVAAVTAAALLLSGHGEEHRSTRLPGAVSLGSSLSGAAESVDCTGTQPSGASLLCTVVQTGLPGRRLRPAEAGAIRRWAVRGARGTLSLEVLAGHGTTLRTLIRSAPVQVPDERLHTFATDLPVRPGDRIGLRVAPGSAVGLRRSPGATTLRALGPVPFQQRTFSPGLERELLLRVDYVPGGRVRIAGRISGAAARRAAPGDVLGSVSVEPEPGQVREAVVVRLPSAVAVDLFAGRRRLVRLPVAGADSRGRLERFDTLGEPTARLRWRNPDGPVLARDYEIGTRSLTASG